MLKTRNSTDQSPIPTRSRWRETRITHVFCNVRLEEQQEDAHNEHTSTPNPVEWNEETRYLQDPRSHSTCKQPRL